MDIYQVGNMLYLVRLSCEWMKELGPNQSPNQKILKNKEN